MKKVSLLITGGTGSLGHALIANIVKVCPSAERVVVFSRDELKQFELAQKYPEAKYNFIRFFIEMCETAIAYAGRSKVSTW